MSRHLPATTTINRRCHSLPHRPDAWYTGPCFLVNSSEASIRWTGKVLETYQIAAFISRDFFSEIPSEMHPKCIQSFPKLSQLYPKCIPNNSCIPVECILPALYHTLGRGVGAGRGLCPRGLYHTIMHSSMMHISLTQIL